jgi:hypothetical protein
VNSRRPGQQAPAKNEVDPKARASTSAGGTAGRKNEDDDDDDEDDDEARRTSPPKEKFTRVRSAKSSLSLARSPSLSSLKSLKWYASASSKNDESNSPRGGGGSVQVVDSQLTQHVA